MLSPRASRAILHSRHPADCILLIKFGLKTSSSVAHLPFLHHKAISASCAQSVVNARPLFLLLGDLLLSGALFHFQQKKGVIPENRSGSFTGYYDMNNARRILSKGSTLLRGCWICQWSKKLPFQKNFDANFIAVKRVIRSSNLRSSDFVIDWFRENHKTFKLIPVFDPTSEFLEMAEAMFIGSKLDTYCSIPGQFAITIHQIIHSFTPHPVQTQYVLQGMGGRRSVAENESLRRSC